MNTAPLLQVKDVCKAFPKPDGEGQHIVLEGVNLTDQYENEFNDTSRNLVYYYHHTGRQVLLGARYQY